MASRPGADRLIPEWMFPDNSKVRIKNTVDKNKFLYLGNILNYSYFEIIFALIRYFYLFLLLSLLSIDC